MKLIGAAYAWNFRWSRAIPSFHRSASVRAQPRAGLLTVTRAIVVSDW